MTSLSAVTRVGHAATWIDVLPHLDARFGGIATSVPRSAREAARRGGHHGALVAFCDQGEAGEPEPGTTIFPLARREWLVGRALRQCFATAMDVADGYHVHGLWQVHSSLTAAHARRAGKPLVISAHGMLDAWALRQKGVKKWAYTKLVEAPNLRSAACLRALTVAERDDYRHLGLRTPIAVIPNGVDIPPGTADEFLARFPELAGKRVVLYLGRIHPKKGPLLLTKAWAVARRGHPDAHLVIAGPDSDGTAAAIGACVAELGLHDSVTLPGMLDGSLVWSALRAASVFVLPSYSEGFSRALLEAMGAGVAVIATRACNFPEIAEHQCGLVIDAEEGALSDALRQLLASSDADLDAMGQRGARLVRERYSWDVVGRQLALLYGWVLGGGSPSPDLNLDLA